MKSVETTQISEEMWSKCDFGLGSKIAYNLKDLNGKNQKIILNFWNFWKMAMKTCKIALGSSP